MPYLLFRVCPHRFFYGFPDLGKGVKVARHHEGERTHPEHLQRRVTPQEEEEMRQILRQYLPDAEGLLKETSVWMYTNTPDYHFLLDFHPRFPRVLVISPCSGHGFKFASVIGEIAADLLLKGQASFDLSLFRWGGNR